VKTAEKQYSLNEEKKTKYIINAGKRINNTKDTKRYFHQIAIVNKIGIKIFPPDINAA
jgi:hypothetical protein